MGEITIRVSDATVMEALEEMASIHGRPVEEEVLSVLQRAVENHRHKGDLVERARQIRAMTPGGVVQTDAVEIIRQMREERDRALGG
jgi:plasmid stability protein